MHHGQNTLTFEQNEARVRCAGEIDFAVAPSLRQAIERSFERVGTCWVDLEAVTFMDSSGVHLLLDAHAAAVARGRCLLVAPPADETVLRPFLRLGLTDGLPLTRPVSPTPV